MLNKVPAAVPVLREILVSITSFVEVLFFLYSPFGG
jgi:hypothetical protein